MRKLKFFIIPILLLCFGLISCSAINKSATQQMMDQTQDPIKIAAAVYFDAMGIYAETARSYLRYKLILEKNSPEANEKAKDLLNQMKERLDYWNTLYGIAKIAAINAASDEFHEMRREVILQLADYLDNK